MFVMVDKVGHSNDKSLSLSPPTKGKAHIWQVRHYSKRDLPLKRPSLHSSLQVSVLTLLWEIMETICHKGLNAALITIA